MAGLQSIENKLEALKDFKANAERISIDALMEEKAIVIDMIFEDQLYIEGVNGYNVPIMDFKPYSPVTIDIKQAKGDPYDRVTLRDGGDFGGEGDVERVSETEAEIISRDQKAEWLKSKYGDEIMWLKPDNLDELRENYIKPILQQKISEI